jgi:hypothetical protein
VSAVDIFFASFVSWVIIGHHNPDWAVLPDEDENVKRLGELHLPPGRYLFPCARTKEDMEDETKKALIASGPWGTINVWSSAPHMGKIWA